MSRESLSQKALMLFHQKSLQAHQAAKEAILSEKIGVEKIDKAIEQYLSIWNNTVRQGILSIAFGAVGGKSEDALALEVALSFIDATMDIHDDIIDNSFSKKKKKTLYGKLGTGSVLLIGDAFLVKGFYYLHKAIETLSKEKQTQIMTNVNGFLAEVVKAHTAETQLRPVKWSVNPQVYLNILKQKAAEIEGRMAVAAIYCGAGEKEIEALGKYGRNLGIFLAVRAEYTDLFEPYELRNRVKYECLPLQILYALQKKGYREKIKRLLSQDNLRKRDVMNLLEILAETRTLKPLNDELRKLQNESLAVLNVLSDSEDKNNLRLIITSMMEDM